MILRSYREPITRRCRRVPAPELTGSGQAGWLLAGLASGELADDVEMADMTGVLLEQVEQDALQGRRIGAVPPLARLADVGKVMGFDNGPGARGLGGQR